MSPDRYGGVSSAIATAIWQVYHTKLGSDLLSCFFFIGLFFVVVVEPIWFGLLEPANICIWIAGQ